MQKTRHGTFPPASYCLFIVVIHLHSARCFAFSPLSCLKKDQRWWWYHSGLFSPAGKEGRPGLRCRRMILLQISISGGCIFFGNHHILSLKKQLSWLFINICYSIESLRWESPWAPASCYLDPVKLFLSKFLVLRAWGLRNIFWLHFFLSWFHQHDFYWSISSVGCFVEGQRLQPAEGWAVKGLWSTQGYGNLDHTQPP